jgi:hypothetical protein
MAPCAGEIVMANSTTADFPAQITPEYLSEYEPLELRIFQHLKRCDNSHQHADENRDMSTSTLGEIKSQKDQADPIRLTKQCKIVGQKSDKAKSKLLKQEVFSREGKVLQNLNSRVRFSPAPPVPYICFPVGRWAMFNRRRSISHKYCIDTFLYRLGQVI